MDCVMWTLTSTQGEPFLFLTPVSKVALRRQHQLHKHLCWSDALFCCTILLTASLFSQDVSVIVVCHTISVAGGRASCACLEYCAAPKLYSAFDSQSIWMSDKCSFLRLLPTFTIYPYDFIAYLRFIVKFADFTTPRASYTPHPLFTLSHRTTYLWHIF